MDFSVLKANLEKKGYVVTEFETADKAVEHLNKEIDQTTVAFGGSVTLQEIGLYNSLNEHNDVFWHWEANEGLTKPEVLKKAALTDVYISSANGIAETGEIINIDGTGNRVASMSYGHRKLYFVVGENKIASTYEKALHRARNIAAPLNAKRLNRKTPCAMNGDQCYDCSSPDRICNIFSVLWSKPGSMDVEVVLIHENLGY